MGKGKTTALINIANSKKYSKEEGDRRLLIVVPRISEINRILNSTTCKEPLDGHKADDLKRLIEQNENICTSHALFNKLDSETIKLIKNSKFPYDLYHDEQPILSCGVIGGDRESDFDNPLMNKIGQDDIVTLFKMEYLKQTENKIVVVNPNYTPYKKGVFNALYQHMKTHTLYAYGTNKIDDNYPNAFISFTSIDLFNAFDNVWILSYLIKNSIVDNYLALNKVDENCIVYYHVDNEQFVKGYLKEYPKNLSRLHLAHERYNQDEYKLTKSEYAKYTDYDFDRISKNVFNFLRSGTHLGKNVKLTDYIFSTFSGYEKKLTKGYKGFSKKSFVACNVKGVNDFQDSTIAIYLCDRFFNPITLNFLNSIEGIVFDEKLFALSEVVQFIWRTKIRVQDDDTPIDVLIPCKRLRNIFLDWYNEGVNQEYLNEIS